MEVDDQWSWEEAAFKEEGTKEEGGKEEGTKEGGTKGDNLSSGHDEELRADEQRCTLKLFFQSESFSDFWGWVSLYLK